MLHFCHISLFLFDFCYDSNILESFRCTFIVHMINISWCIECEDKLFCFMRSLGVSYDKSAKLYFSLESDVSTKEPNIIHNKNMYSNVFVFVVLMYKLVSLVLVYKLLRTRFIEEDLACFPIKLAEEVGSKHLFKPRMVWTGACPNYLRQKLRYMICFQNWEGTSSWNPQ